MKIALQLHSLKNFNSCVSVLGGLESAPISRLKNLKVCSYQIFRYLIINRLP